MRVKQEEYVRLTEEYCFKLDVIQSAIIEEKSKKELVEGGLDLLFANALRNLHEDDEITEEGLENGLDLLPDFLEDRLRNELAEEDK